MPSPASETPPPSRKLRTKSIPHVMLTTLLFADVPWIQRRVNYGEGVVHVHFIPARLRDRLAMNYSRLEDYFQWLTDRNLARNFQRAPGMVQVDLVLPKDAG